MQNSHSSKSTGPQTNISAWWLLLISGVVILPVVFLTGITVQGRYVYLAPYLSITFGLVSILSIIITVLNRKRISGWGLMLAPSIVLLLLAGFIAFIGLTSKINENVFAFYIGFAFFFASFFTVSFSFAMKNFMIKLWPLTLCFSILTMLLSMGLFLYPLHEALMLQTWTVFAWISLLLTHLITAFLVLFSNKQSKKSVVQVTGI
ncbi:hypothetical protein DW091_19290 [Eubacterium sp. AM05-23]|uniref:hypothetical protein n=1 Tax=Eubacterium TaxID=1730 RepID=UPI000E528459|nr:MULTISPECIES: hypothetical protein [Eubacterium]RHO53585.1 hypothetical protein DW091_19290 [Eubacterium sp. AM05-23]